MALVARGIAGAGNGNVGIIRTTGKTFSIVYVLSWEPWANCIQSTDSG